MKIQNRLSDGFISQTWCYRIRASPAPLRTTYSHRMLSMDHPICAQAFRGWRELSPVSGTNTGLRYTLTVSHKHTLTVSHKHIIYRCADKFVARPGRKQGNVSVRIKWIYFGALLCKKKKKTWWQLASRCCWNRARYLRVSELVSFLVGLRTYQHPG